MEIVPHNDGDRASQQWRLCPTTEGKCNPVLSYPITTEGATDSCLEDVHLRIVVSHGVAC
eukprot:616627-Pelagomonas_calceolata.AAC.1